MIHLLVVDRDGPRALDAPASFEVLWAHCAEDALEKIARNRRIDAVLFFDDATARETVESLAAGGAGCPPLFQPGRTSVAGVVALGGSLFDDIRKSLGE